MWNVIMLVYDCQELFGKNLRQRMGKGPNAGSAQGGAQRSPRKTRTTMRRRTALTHQRTLRGSTEGTEEEA
jgi:hypothetical protein